MPSKKMPTLVGILLVLFVLALTVILVQYRTRFLSRAGSSVTPKNILITNLKPTQFSLFWVTDDKTTGFVNYGTSDSLGTLVFDKRDKTIGKQGAYVTHFVTINNLESGKTYYFKIGANNQLFGGTYSASQNCKDFIEGAVPNSVFKITLPKSLTSTTARSIPVNGSVTTKDTEPSEGSFVCLEIPETFPLSDMTSPSGSYFIPLVSVLKMDATILTSLPETIVEKITIYGPNNEQTIANVLALNDHAVPPLTLGSTYDLTKKELVPTMTLVQAPSPTIAAGVSPVATPAVSLVELSSPSGSISDTLPTFRGKGKPGQVIDIQVHSEATLSATIKVDQNGFWSWTPPKNLLPGNHTVTITTRDVNGNISRVVRNFQVLAANPILPVSSGSTSATVQTVTPTVRPTIKPLASATATPTPRPTIKPLALATVTPTLRPTSIPTVRPTVIPTIAPTAIPTTIPTLPPVIPTNFPTAIPTKAELVEAGTTYPYYLFFGFGIMSIITGSFMLLKKRVQV